MSNSKLVTYTRISPFRNSPRNHKIDTISIHCVAGQCSIETLGSIFQSKEASANYGIGPDGRIGQYVDEADRSWCTSSGSNDHRAITIEVASDGNHPYAVTDAAIRSLLCLLVDICRRNDIKELRWKNDPALIGHPDQQNLTVHRWFANKACPGQYLLDRHSWIAAEVNSRLKSDLPFVDISTDDWYYESVKWGVSKGITSGISDLLFGGEDVITRAQAITMLWQLYGAPEPSSYQEYHDVRPTEYFSKAAQWARQKGITAGIGGGNFGPDEICTRAQIVTMLWKAAGAPDTAGNSFEDVSQTDYFRDAVYWARANGITAGVTENLFAPDNPCTRAQVVTMLYQMHYKI